MNPLKYSPGYRPGFVSSGTPDYGSLS